MTVHAISADVYIAPTKAATTGAIIPNIQDNLVEWSDGQKTQAVGGGLERDAWDNVRDGEYSPSELRFSLRNVSAQTINLLFGFTTDGSGNLESDANDTPSEYTLAVRPRDGTSKIIYGPRWVLHPDSVASLRFSRDLSFHDDTEIVLMPQRSTDGTKRAYMLDSAATIDTYYGL